MRYSGTVVAVHCDRGFGFLESSDFAKDLFFHCDQLSDDLEFDEQLIERRVSFEVSEQDKRGPRAIDVRATE